MILIPVGCCSCDSLGKGKPELHRTDSHHLFRHDLFLPCSAFSKFQVLALSLRGSFLINVLVPWLLTPHIVNSFTASIAAYFITADKTILECARRNSQNERTA